MSETPAPEPVKLNLQAPTSDADLLDLLRVETYMGVADLAVATEVTATAVRQRLMRLMADGLVQRVAIRSGRGRPKHRYGLTEKGLRLTGSNFTDLATALWTEITRSTDRGARDDVLKRIAHALSQQYAGEIRGATVLERMQSLSELLAQRRIPASIESLGSKLVMRIHACPYPKLAEKDRSVCAMEKLLLSTLLGEKVEMTDCRLDGESGCRFEMCGP
ncbi:MAG: hypothetical protein JXB62_19405 [Pirellulales bacterium]|nr:hypothetical protein [Pirellulales bacterium]